MSSGPYPLTDILAVARVHPFYSQEEYPPTADALDQVLAKSKEEAGNALELKSIPLLRKDTLSKQVARLIVDQDPRNGYRQQNYCTVTGGGSGGAPLMFAMDSLESRQQRAATGTLMRNCGLLGPGDWVLTVHVSGNLYRVLEFVTEIMEKAGAAVVCAGPEMPYQDVIANMILYKINVLAGDAAQLVQVTRFISSLPKDQQQLLGITKVFYTSDMLTPAQRSFLRSVLGDIVICSLMASSEIGGMGVASSELMGLTDENHVEFIYDPRVINLEVVPMSIEEPDERGLYRTECTENLPDGEVGLLAVTNLYRLRNPLVRYLCGDVASLHPLPTSIRSRLPATEEDVQQYRVVRIYGRDRRISFTWYGEYFHFNVVQKQMHSAEWGVLQWQILLGSKEEANNPDDRMEIRIMRSPEEHVGMNGLISSKELTAKIRKLFKVFDFNEELFKLTYVSSLDGFERSNTGRKVINFVDWRQ
ncbi:hypothetical protein BDV41DRAFT_565005 [Aspergillus transmontanensis]|uniref:AMP-dependent synthetase/ligase domain-containing protein n=1 Tax=Aspergillus transmontanensis TaxID=1034304 RepID=A0A5N6VVS7_9EURO|nr:hypothetical protein BDV41DRAFT_565005 [Aspergillus transmontanensis]